MNTEHTKGKFGYQLNSHGSFNLTSDFGKNIVAENLTEHDALHLSSLSVQNRELREALKMCVSLMNDPPQVIRSNDTDAYRNAISALSKTATKETKE